MRGRRQASSQQGLSANDAVQNSPPRLLVFHNKREIIEVSEEHLKGGELFEFVSSRNGGSGDNLLSDYPAPFSMLSGTYLKIDDIKTKI